MPDQAVAKAELDGRALVDLAKKVDAGKASNEERAVFRRQLEATPDMWRIFADLALQAEHNLIDGLPATMQDGLHAGRLAVQRGLGYETAPPIEKLLIEAVGLAWLRLGIVELKQASNSRGGIGIPQADYWNRTLTAAQGRYLRALTTLARVRRLLRPGAVQVNIGQQVTAAQVLAGKGEG